MFSVRTYLLVWVVFITIISCRKKEDFSTTRLIAHAGAGLHIQSSPFHDDSKEAVQYAVQLAGIEGVEVDVQSSKNNTSWLFHNGELDEKTNGEGCIQQKSDAELEQLHYSGLKNESLARLTDLSFFPSEKYLFLDVRSLNTCTGQIVSIDSVILSLKKAVTQLNISSVNLIITNPNWISRLSDEGWNIYVQRDNIQSYLSLELWDKTKGVCMSNNKVGKEDIAQLHTFDKQMIIFDVRSPKGTRSALKKHPDFLMVDDLKVALIEKYP